MTRLETAQEAYIKTFRLLPPEPFGVSDDAIAQELERAIVRGQPVPDDFDWWGYMPPDAVA